MKAAHFFLYTGASDEAFEAAEERDATPLRFTSLPVEISQRSVSFIAQFRPQRCTDSMLRAISSDHGITWNFGLRGSWSLG